MNIVQIGAAGHYAYALPTAKKYGMKFVGICCPDVEDHLSRALNHLEKFGFAPRVYEDAEEMLEKEKPDVAVINTVMYENARYAMMALEKGISVFCEKPVATDPETLKELEAVYARAKKKNGSVCFCGIRNRGIIFDFPNQKTFRACDKFICGFGNRAKR